MLLKQINFLSLFIAAALLQGCSFTSEPVKTVKKELHWKRQQLYVADVGFPVTTLNNYYQPAGSEKAYFLDPVTRSFHVLDAGSGSFRLAGLLPDLTTEWEGVFTVDEKRKRIHIFYSDSVVHYSFKGDRRGMDVIPDAGGFIYASSRDFAPIFKNGKLYISYFPDVEGSFRNPAHYTAAVEAEIDLLSREWKLLPQKYPPAYQQNCYSYAFQAKRIAISPDVHGYVFPNSDSIYICNIRTGEQSVRFFGVVQRPKFAYIPFKAISSLNETVLIELVKSNPHYNTLFSAPLAGFYLRELITPPEKEGDGYGQTTAVFDRNFNYIGETKAFEWLVDSRQGLLAVELKNQQLIVTRLTW
jgi:hypothetical protein